MTPPTTKKKNKAKVIDPEQHIQTLVVKTQNIQELEQIKSLLHNITILAHNANVALNQFNDTIKSIKTL